jgi:hypothetical protein
MFRGQFNGLKDLIDAVPAGPPGQNGTSVTGHRAIIDGTNTLNPGDAGPGQRELGRGECAVHVWDTQRSRRREQSAHHELHRGWRDDTQSR